MLIVGAMAGPAVQNARATHDQLVKEWAKPSPDLDRCGKLLAELKVGRAGDISLRVVVIDL